MSLMSDFKDFALRGNVVDMAVGIIIGAAFGKIVASLVNDLIMPVVGNLIGGVDFSKLGYVLKAAEGEVEAVVVRYGAFIQTIIDFLIIGLAIFMAIKVMNRMQRKKEEEDAAPAEPSEEVQLLRDIRDSLKKGD